jgi:hypothetical protein
MCFLASELCLKLRMSIIEHEKNEIKNKINFGLLGNI